MPSLNSQGAVNRTSDLTSKEKPREIKRLGDRERALLGKALGAKLLRPLGLVILSSLGHSAVLLAEHELDVARARHVRVGAA